MAGPVGSSPKLVAGLAVLGAAAVGLAIGAEAPWTIAGLVIAAAVLLTAVLDRISTRVIRLGYVEIPVLMLLVAGLSLRARDASELADNPLDAAGLVKLGATMLALGIGLLAIVTPGPVRVNLSKPFVLYACYAAVAFVGIAVSEMPPLTAYRVIEVIAALIVVAGALRATGPGASLRIIKLLRGWSFVMLVIAWIAVAVAPSLALEPVESPIPYRIDLPTLGITANALGTYGALLAVWCLAALFDRSASGRKAGRGLNIAGFVFGVISVIGAQYRTGYVALAIVVAVVFLLRARLALLFGLLTVMVALSLWGPAVSDVEPYLLRGQSRAEAAELSGRIEWWSLAEPMWDRSPVVGNGLRTASRFLLADAGYGETGTIHSAWVEALVGVGILGVGLLLLALLTALYRAFRLALAGGSIAPLLVLLVLTARSITGTSFEAGGFQLVLFLAVVIALGRRDRFSPGRRVPGRWSQEAPRPA